MYIRSLHLLLCKDIVEITTLSYLFYWWLHWLKQDKQKQLSLYFYGYSLFWAACSLGNLTTLLTCIEYTAPYTIILFILIHQKNLQRNFISLFKVKPAQKTDIDWLQEIVRFCLQANGNISILIEHQNSLNNLLSINVPMHTQISTQLLQFLYHSSDFNAKHYILIDTQGNILGIDVTWQKPLALTGINENESTKASYYLMNSDAFMLQYNHQNRLFTIIMKEHIYTNLTTAQVLQSITHYLASSENKKGPKNEAPYISSDQQQPHA
ncbi:MAG: hypothetical protein WD055_04990 [Candidatus Dependentiae bacterium]